MWRPGSTQCSPTARLGEGCHQPLFYPPDSHHSFGRAFPAGQGDLCSLRKEALMNRMRPARGVHTAHRKEAFEISKQTLTHDFQN